MPLSELLGQPRAQRLLTGALDQLSHAYLFVGPEQVGKRTAARLFAQAINCLTPGALGCGHCKECLAIAHDNHPDVRVWDVPEGEKTFKVERVRELIQAVAWHPYQGKRKVHILAAMDAIGLAGANALLKTLEEPPASTTLILLARDADAVLPTILSRCQVIPFGLSPVETVAAALEARLGLDAYAARELAFRSQGRIGLAFDLAATPTGPAGLPSWPQPGDLLGWTDAIASKPEPEQTALLDGLLAWLRDVALVAAGAPASQLRHAHEVSQLAEWAARAPLPVWLERARRVEAARERLAGHGNARLVFDELARALVA